MDKRYISKIIAGWYQEHKRNLPWRTTKDPYKIWISEIILQQTRVNQGISYYQKFIKSFPTIEKLSKAPEQQVLRLWQGLGYYTRARNLHKCAKSIVDNYRGQFPRTFWELKELPGIGEYTAAAIASFSFQEKVAVVDGNVYRVLARVFGIDTPINSTLGKRQFSELANQIIPTESPDLHNQAMMEFGALQCVPKNPDCEICPLRNSCFAYKKKLQAVLPVKEKIKTIKKRYFYYVIFHSKNSIAMKKRNQKDIWHGLYDFYLIEKSSNKKALEILREDSLLNAISFDKKKLSITKPVKHVLSHQIIFCRFIHVDLNGEAFRNKEGLALYSPKKVAELPKPALITKYLQSTHFL